MLQGLMSTPVASVRSEVSLFLLSCFTFITSLCKEVMSTQDGRGEGVEDEEDEYD